MEMMWLLLIIGVFIIAIFAKSIIMSLGSMMACMLGVYLMQVETDAPLKWFVIAIMMIMVAFQMVYLVRGVKHI